MPVTVEFENGTKREFPDATNARWHGQGVVLQLADGKERAYDGPVVELTVNGIVIPPN